MSRMSLSWSVHFYQNDDAGGASPALPEVEDDDTAGVAAMAMAARHRIGVEIASYEEAESSGNSPSRQAGGKLCSTWEQAGRFTPPSQFKYRRLYNEQIRNQRPDQIGPEILRRMKRDK